MMVGTDKSLDSSSPAETPVNLLRGRNVKVVADDMQIPALVGLIVSFGAANKFCLFLIDPRCCS
jgi:hypothetical protein